MKIDLVVGFYRQEHVWPLIAWGISGNLDTIHRVILVNDEPWTPSSRASVEAVARNYENFPPLVLLDHAHEGFGAHRCVRQGAKAVKTGWWAHMDGDIILAPASLSKIASEPERGIMRCGLSHDLEDDVTLAQVQSEPVVKRHDEREGRTVGTWKDARDLYIFSHKDDYFAIGGHDADFPGYGFVDYDVAMRWLMHFGPESIEICNSAHSYHIGGLRPKHDSDPGNQDLFMSTANRFSAWASKQRSGS
jgi:hypothetical protein